jgi:ABC-type dipeptide/oligopeptide/nickel transport system permease subunit
VILTISVPELILAEGALSFLGLGFSRRWSAGRAFARRHHLERSHKPLIMRPGIVILLTCT